MGCSQAQATKPKPSQTSHKEVTRKATEKAIVVRRSTTDPPSKGATDETTSKGRKCKGNVKEIKKLKTRRNPPSKLELPYQQRAEGVMH